MFALSKREYIKQATDLNHYISASYTK